MPGRFGSGQTAKRRAKMLRGGPDAHVDRQHDRRRVVGVHGLDRDARMGVAAAHVQRSTRACSRLQLGRGQRTLLAHVRDRSTSS